MNTSARGLSLTFAALLLVTACGGGDDAADAPEPAGDGPDQTDSGSAEGGDAAEEEQPPPIYQMIDIEPAETADEAREHLDQYQDELEEIIVTEGWTDGYTGEYHDGWPQSEEEFAALYANIVAGHDPAGDYGLSDAAARAGFMAGARGQQDLAFSIPERPPSQHDEHWWDAKECDDVEVEIAYEIEPPGHHGIDWYVRTEHRYTSESGCDLTQPTYSTLWSMWIDEDDHEHGFGLSNFRPTQLTHSDEHPSLFDDQEETA